ncbi:unnamed protein product [Cyprideis torosa]|uniref:PEHE domain-containing protein n=1 Tax=Cyprideis torosa TaxID=163714 RepID=A0A7R8W701_9CRUS|nr:unnamed protein product [Cyprideis torosa]CAG0887015.1 unnamed protein product [Cyprideis torosa]
MLECIASDTSQSTSAGRTGILSYVSGLWNSMRLGSTVVAGAGSGWSAEKSNCREGSLDQENLQQRLNGYPVIRDGNDDAPSTDTPKKGSGLSNKNYSPSSRGAYSADFDHAYTAASFHHPHQKVNRQHNANAAIPSHIVQQAPNLTSTKLRRDEERTTLCRQIVKHYEQLSEEKRRLGEKVLELQIENQSLRNRNLELEREVKRSASVARKATAFSWGYRQQQRTAAAASRLQRFRRSSLSTTGGKSSSRRVSSGGSLALERPKRRSALRRRRFSPSSVTREDQHQPRQKPRTSAPSSASSSRHPSASSQQSNNRAILCLEPSRERPRTTKIEIPPCVRKQFSCLWQMEGTEDLSDAVFERRHQKYEQDEKRRKRWDIQRLRAQSQASQLRESCQSPLPPPPTDHSSLPPNSHLPSSSSASFFSCRTKNGDSPVDLPSSSSRERRRRSSHRLSVSGTTTDEDNENYDQRDPHLVEVIRVVEVCHAPPSASSFRSFRPPCLDSPTISSDVLSDQNLSPNQGKPETPDKHLYINMGRFRCLRPSSRVRIFSLPASFFEEVRTSHVRSLRLRSTDSSTPSVTKENKRLDPTEVLMSECDAGVKRRSLRSSSSLTSEARTPQTELLSPVSSSASLESENSSNALETEKRLKSREEAPEQERRKRRRSSGAERVELTKPRLSTLRPRLLLAKAVTDVPLSLLDEMADSPASLKDEEDSPLSVVVPRVTRLRQASRSGGLTESEEESPSSKRKFLSGDADDFEVEDMISDVSCLSLAAKYVARDVDL